MHATFPTYLQSRQCGFTCTGLKTAHVSDWSLDFLTSFLANRLSVRLGAGCETFTTNFTLFNPNDQDKETEDGNSLPLGLGIGLGVGIPVLVSAAFGAWWMRRRKRRQLSAAQTSDRPSQEHMNPDNRHAETTSAPPYSDSNADDGGFSDGFKTVQERSIAELGENIYELSPNQQIHEAEPLSVKAEPRELP